MPKTKRRKAPITTTKVTQKASSSKSSRTLIRSFHVLLKRQAQLQDSVQDVTSAQQLANVQHEIDGLGGLAAYQQVSSIGQGDDRGGGSHKVLISWLRELGMLPSKVEKKYR